MHRQIQVGDRLRSILRYTQALPGQWYTLRSAANVVERVSLLRFMLYQYLAFFGVVKRRDRFVRFRGHTYVFEQTAELLVLTEIYRDRAYSRDEAFLPRGGRSVVDVGANVGLFTIYHAAAGARVLAIEPNEGPHRRLVAAVAANDLGGRVKIFRAAIGERRGRARIDTFSSTLPQAKAVRGTTVVGRAVPVEADAPVEDDQVEVVPLDEVLSEHYDAPTIDLLKIDVEGAEIDVLRGSSATLAHTRRVVLEYHSEDLLAGVRQLLTAAGFCEVWEHSILPGVGMLYMARREDEKVEARS
jgi:FkbM family methyltransferase